MKLTNEQKKIAEEKLSYFVSHSCEVCSSGEWILNDTLFELREFQGGGLVLGPTSSIFPVVTVTCKKCGRSHFFSAILLGLMKK